MNKPRDLKYSMKTIIKVLLSNKKILRFNFRYPLQMPMKGNI